MAAPKSPYLADFPEFSRQIRELSPRDGFTPSCTHHLVEADAAEEVEGALCVAFERRFGTRPRSWAVRPSEGARSERLAEGLLR